jgi:glutamate racemase
MTDKKLYKPVVVFDAGIGSYDIASRVSKAFPTQDILYFADRASFPYGSKSKSELTVCIEKAIEFFLRFDPAAIILASNAPSILVLDSIKDNYSVPIIGVRPPVEEALSLSKNKNIGVLGVSSLIKSKEITDYVQKWENKDSKINLIEASDLVDLVESGKFIHDEVGTTNIVNDKMKKLSDSIDVFTLSSTHLPWLRDYFVETCPTKTFIDPANEVIDVVRPYTIEGIGQLCICASENEIYTISDFEVMLEKLGINGTVVSKDELERFYFSYKE